MICLTKVYDDRQSETLFFNRESKAKEVLKKSKAKHNKIWLTGDNFKIESRENSYYSDKDIVSKIEVVTEVISEILNKNKDAEIRITRINNDMY
ncbi:hypothetical protein [Arsenophonus nasoniae]|uniref:Uncharacterized protein n=1 Tax=Arsenophonus nasoniae TaxID=638 RepID=A0AA95GGL6_9GAMM|nr:hypothetical protein [Arsenophonus nasoniae]WGL95980.1 hypothetical protein QE207_05180 [Arsenophonus nasoniae]